MTGLSDLSAGVDSAGQLALFILADETQITDKAILLVKSPRDSIGKKSSKGAKGILTPMLLATVKDSLNHTQVIAIVYQTIKYRVTTYESENGGLFTIYAVPDKTNPTIGVDTPQEEEQQFNMPTDGDD